jgi:phosphoribosylaminoimidazolecarboxamide formyltransferase/IMP cyclohydrolase
MSCVNIICFKDVIVLVDYLDYEKIINKIKNNNLTLNDRKELAIKAFKYCKEYNSDIENYLINNKI